MSTPSSSLKPTALHAQHVAAGARLVEYAGWEMPLEYSGITDEHMAVRTRAGLFDVSHMGEIELAGTDALATLQWLTSNDVARLAIGQIQYSALTTPAGTFVDDVLVYRMGEDHYLMVVNAGNAKKAHTWIATHARERGGDVAVVNASARYALIALQGPESAAILQPLTGVDLASLKYYWWAAGEVAGARVTVSRTGYTGEDGFEIFVPPAQAPKVWGAIVDAGREVDLRPCGLGARDTLRLEAAMRLYGQDMDEETTVIEAGLGWIVGRDKPAFLGADVLAAERVNGPQRGLAAFEMMDPGIARHGHAVMGAGDAVCGQVTSGTRTPFLKKAIGFAIVPADQAVVGQEIVIDIRGRRTRARVVAEPFYKRPRPAPARA
jgi:aminomethyltransferase